MEWSHTDKREKAKKGHDQRWQIWTKRRGERERVREGEKEKSEIKKRKMT